MNFSGWSEKEIKAWFASGAKKAPTKKKATKKKAATKKKSTAKKKPARKPPAKKPAAAKKPTTRFKCRECGKTKKIAGGTRHAVHYTASTPGAVGRCLSCSPWPAKKTRVKKKVLRAKKPSAKKTPAKKRAKKPISPPARRTGSLTTSELNWLARNGWSSAQIKRMSVAEARRLIAAGEPKAPGTQTRLAGKSPARRPPARSGVLVECVLEGGKLRVQPVGGQGYAIKKIQFPRHLRHDGCLYEVDALDDKGTHYRAVGEIKEASPFERGLVGTPVPARPAPRKPAPRQTAAPKAKGGRAVLLAHKWKPSCDPRGWWISEKLDGVRAYWDGSSFYSRAGNPFYPPAWFTKGLPKTPLDGELWIGRGMFQQTVSVVRSQGLSDAWKKVRYLVFDAPSHPGGFEERLAAVRQLVKGAPYAQAVQHYRCKGEGHMHNELASVEAKGGEGLMLREPGSPYEPRRSHTLLKVKTFHDAEAMIEGYYPGNGKHKGVIGGYWVETIKDENVRAGIRFKIGTGLTDAERADPLSIGTVITYRYQELSDSGTPRFASKVRVRSNPRRTWA